MDYNYILPDIEQYCPDVYSIFEEVMPDQMKISLDYINKFRK